MCINTSPAEGVLIVNFCSSTAIAIDVFPIVSFFRNYHRVERFNFVDDNNTIVCPYKDKSVDVSVYLSLNDERENV